jgi:2'-5' RNA ligase
MARNPFSPHLTLARAEGIRPNPPIVPQRDVPFFGEWDVKSVVLTQSHLGHGPPSYEECDRFPLVGEGRRVGA